MDTKKLVTKLAATMLLLGVSGGAVFGATQYFGNVEHAEHGLTAGNGNSTTGVVSSSFDTKNFQEDHEKVQIISTEKGNENVLWTAKEVRQETSTGYTSDDGVTWAETTPDVVDVTEYSYQDYDQAIKDTDFTGVFTQSFEQDGLSIYTQYDHNEKNVNNEEMLLSTFNYNNGHFEVNEQRTLDWDGTEILTSAITSSTEKVTNQREYTSANGNTFKLSDDKDTGELRTTVLISYDDYRAIITFTGLSDKEIHEVLDAIHVE